jgi:FixJ family two-component response regulator
VNTKSVGAQRPPNDRRLVVLVDDDLALLGALSFALQAEDYLVKAHSDGESLLAGAVPAGCLVIDQRLGGGMSGLDLVSEIRANGGANPAILMTTNPEPHVRRRAAAAGIPIVEKPLLGPTLANAIERACLSQGGRG